MFELGNTLNYQLKYLVRTQLLKIGWIGTILDAGGSYPGIVIHKRRDYRPLWV